jgi:hypothetical protein
MRNKKIHWRNWIGLVVFEVYYDLILFKFWLLQMIDIIYFLFLLKNHEINIFYLNVNNWHLTHSGSCGIDNDIV